MAVKNPKIRFKVRVEDRTEITANEGEISMGMRVIPHIGKPEIPTKDIYDAIVQQFGLKKGKKRYRIVQEIKV